MGWFSGTRPGNLGLHHGRFAAPPNPAPNNVSSEADPRTDPQHYVAPLSYRGDAAHAWARLREIVASMPRAKIITSTPTYLYVEFRSRLMGFVDDTEFYLDAQAHAIQVRSAARLGRGDFGVNRSRVETIRARFARQAPQVQ